MTTQEIIDWRTSLKGGKNIPLRIIFDNQFNVDESSVFTYVKWDDNNGIIYIFRLPNFSDSTNPNNIPNAFQVFSAPYDKIWYLVATTPMQFIDDVFESIEANGCVFREGFKEYIKTGLTEAMHPNRWRMEHADINAISGFKATDESTMYYMGKFPEPFKETREHAEYNQWIKDQKNKEQNNTDPDNP